MNDFDLERPHWHCWNFLRPASQVISFLLPSTGVAPTSHPEVLLLSFGGYWCPLGTPHISPSLLGDIYSQVQHNLVEEYAGPDKETKKLHTKVAVRISHSYWQELGP